MAEGRRRFKFLKEIAQGGFGKVYLAEMMTGENFSSICAVKVLHARWSENAEVVMRSRDEARLLGRLRHRNIVRVESLTRIQSQVAIVMEYLEGADLKSVMTALREQGRPFPRQSAFEVIGLIASALDAAYNQVPLNGTEPLAVIHRDIKPSNAMVTVEGDVKVLDFGTARASFEHREAKTQALSFGSAAYMSPERLMGEDDTPAADVFSLGITLYELLTLDSFGKIAIRPEKFERTLDERLEALDLSALPDEVRTQALEVMRVMLAYEPSQRLTAAQVIEVMETLAESCRDGGLKRLAREVVRPLVTLQTPESDPDDPLNGQTVFEDTSTIHAGSFTTTSEEWVEGVSEDAPFEVPPELSDVAAAPSAGGYANPPGAEPPALNPSAEAHSAPSLRPSLPTAPSGPVGLSSEPGLPTGAHAPLGREPALPMEPNGTGGSAAPPAPPPIQTVVPAPVSSAPTYVTANVGRVDEAPASSASASGGRAALIVGVVGVLLAAAAGVAFVVLRPAPTEPVAADSAPAKSNLKAGDEAADYGAPADGKGAVVLTVPEGADEVIVRRIGTTLNVGWDGTRYLNLRDLDEGEYIGDVRLPSGGGSKATFAVKKGSTCSYRFDPRDGAWKEAECRP
jgi:serine/threonine protein kinase